MCPPLREYSSEEQKKAADDIAALPEGNSLPGYITDYAQLREACRAIERDDE